MPFDLAAREFIVQFHTLLNDDALKLDVNMEKAIVQTFTQILPGIDAKYRDEGDSLLFIL